MDDASFAPALLAAVRGDADFQVIQAAVVVLAVYRACCTQFAGRKVQGAPARDALPSSSSKQAACLLPCPQAARAATQLRAVLCVTLFRMGSARVLSPASQAARGKTLVFAADTAAADAAAEVLAGGGVSPLVVYHKVCMKGMVFCFRLVSFFMVVIDCVPHVLCRHERHCRLSSSCCSM